MVSAISRFIFGTPVHKGQRGVTTATNFGTEIAINAFLREILRTLLPVTEGFRGWPIQRTHFLLQTSNI